MSNIGTPDVDPWLTIKGAAADVLRRWAVTFVSYRRPVPACASLHKRTKGSLVSIGLPVVTGTLYECGVGVTRDDSGAWRRPRPAVWPISVISGERGSVPSLTSASDTGGTRPREGATHG